MHNTNESEQNTFENNRTLIEVMAKLEQIVLQKTDENAPLAVTKLVGNAELLVPMAGFIDKEKELARLNKEMEKLNDEIQRIENKLNNQAFVAKAPEAVIAKEREKMQEYQVGLEKLNAHYLSIKKL